MTNATEKNAKTFAGAAVFSSTVTLPALTFSDSNNNIFAGLTLPTSVGSSNLGLGRQVFRAMVGGTGNIALGQDVFFSFDTGVDNIALGRQAGVNVGGNPQRNTFLGPQTGYVAFSGPFNDSTAVGSGALITADNQIKMGRSSETVVFAGNATFDVNLPTTSQTPTLSTQLAPKGYNDATYVPIVLVPNVTHTGTYSTAIPFTVSPIYVADSTGAISSQLINVAFASTGEPNIATLNLGNAQSMQISWNVSLLTNYALTSISGANIQYMLGCNLSTSLGNLTTFSFPNCISIGNSGFGLTAAALTSLSMPLLQSSGFTFSLSLPLLTSLNLSSFASCASSMTLTLAALTTFSMPALSYVGANFIPTLAVATSVTLTSLATIIGAFTWSSALLTTLSLPALITVGTTFAITAANMTTFSMGSTLKTIGGNFTMTGMALNQASVDGILVSLAALDGTGGTTAYSSKTVNLSGGTSSAPSATGLTAKAVLQARSCTVTTN
jgi:hypothetical protein